MYGNKNNRILFEKWTNESLYSSFYFLEKRFWTHTAIYCVYISGVISVD